MIRDSRKDKAYFDRYIGKQTERIREKKVKLSACSDKDTEKRARINMSLLHYEMDLLVASYSAGEGYDLIEDKLVSVVETLCQSRSGDYETIMNILAFCILLDRRDLGKKVYEWNASYIDSDKLLHFFSEYLNSGQIVWQGTFVIEGIYDRLEEVVEERDEDVLIVYLARWYEKRTDFAWYGSDQNQYDTYVGYWSFESAAIARMLGINETALSEIDVYPLFA